MRAFGLAATTLAVALLSACASAGTARVLTVGQMATLAPGQQVALPDGAYLRYVGVVADSRCPPKVQCIRAGDADVAFEHAAPGATPRRIVLNLPEAPSAPIGRLTLRIVALEFGDAPKATIRIDATPD